MRADPTAHRNGRTETDGGGGKEENVQNKPFVSMFTYIYIYVYA